MRIKIDIEVDLLNLIFRIYFVAESLIEEGRDAVFQMSSRGMAGDCGTISTSSKMESLGINEVGDARKLYFAAEN